MSGRVRLQYPHCFLVLVAEKDKKKNDCRSAFCSPHIPVNLGQKLVVLKEYLPLAVVTHTERLQGGKKQSGWEDGWKRREKKEKETYMIFHRAFRLPSDHLVHKLVVQVPVLLNRRVPLVDLERKQVQQDLREEKSETSEAKEEEKKEKRKK